MPSTGRYLLEWCDSECYALVIPIINFNGYMYSVRKRLVFVSVIIVMFFMNGTSSY